jgi:hypothetical protein
VLGITDAIFVRLAVDGEALGFSLGLRLTVGSELGKSEGMVDGNDVGDADVGDIEGNSVGP